MSKVLVDTNVILRALLHDNEKQAKQADEIIKAGAWTLPEVLAEVDHVLRTFYNVERKDIARQLFTAVNLVEVERREVIFRAIKIFAETKLDFVDCILAAYHDVENAEVFTFDKDLNKVIKREEK
ncbi:MAG: PIN domain-containing protein [Selenomonadaceae bacterium]|nr:PIN domain-containing protein [Selenomonadaceae bacterium]MBR4904636.1 PIN domain-containing protein [Selenomonadaceae bacterium]